MQAIRVVLCKVKLYMQIFEQSQLFMMNPKTVLNAIKSRLRSESGS